MSAIIKIGAKEKAYGDFKLSAQQVTNLSAGSHVEFDTSAGNLALSTGTGQARGLITLPAGSTYKLQGRIGCSFTNNDGIANYQWWDVTNNVGLGVPVRSMSLAGGAASSTTNDAVCIVTPVSQIQVELRITSVENGSIIDIASTTRGTYAYIEAIEAPLLTSKVNTQNGTANNLTLTGRTGLPDGGAVRADGNLNLGSETGSAHRLFVHSNHATDAAVAIRQDGAAPIQVWQVAGAVERMRIDSNGNVGIGTNSPSKRLSVNGATIGVNGGSFYCSSGATGFDNFTDRTAPGDAFYHRFIHTPAGGWWAYRSDYINDLGTPNIAFIPFVYHRNGAMQFRVAWNGNVSNLNNSYGAISDIKLKENIVDATPKLDKLNQVRVVSYNLKTQPDQKLLGVIADELQAIFPGIVEETEDLDKEGNKTGTSTKSVKYSVFIPMLIKAVQELTEKNNELEARLSALENKV